MRDTPAVPCKHVVTSQSARTAPSAQYSYAGAAERQHDPLTGTATTATPDAEPGGGGPVLKGDGAPVHGNSWYQADRATRNRTCSDQRDPDAGQRRRPGLRGAG